MWSIHYGLHFTITHSFFKRQFQICSKLHQLSWEKRQCIYVQDKLFVTWTPIQRTCCLFKKTKGKNKLKFPIFENTLLSSPKQSKIGHKYFIFNQEWGHMILQSPVFYIWCIDSWQHHNDFILRYHKTKH